MFSFILKVLSALQLIEFIADVVALTCHIIADADIVTIYYVYSGGLTLS